MRARRYLRQQHRRKAAERSCLGLLLSCLLFLGGCQPGSDSSTSPEAPHPTDPQLVRQTIMAVVDLYRIAVLQEDIDSLQALLQTSGTLSEPALRHQSRQAAVSVAGVQAFRDAMTEAFRTVTVTDLQIPAETVQVAVDQRSVAFLEVESVEDPITLAQRTRLFRTTFQLSQDVAAGVVTFRIGGVQREGPLVQITTPGQVQAGALTRIEVTPGALALAGGEIEMPETHAAFTLVADGDRFQGLYTPPPGPHPQPLRVRLQGQNGMAVTLHHRYRLWTPGELVVQPLALDAVDGRPLPCFFAVAVAPDGTIWGGANGGNAARPDCAPDEGAIGGGQIYRVAPGASRAVFEGALTQDPAGQVDDIAVDTLGRVHFLVRAAGSAAFPPVSQDVVLDQGTFCGTVNVFAPNQDYPLRVQEPGGMEQPSPGTRAVDAGDGKLWLFGSDGGVAQVTDAFRDGHCPTAGVAVRYDPVFRRQDSGLLANTVPALVVGANGTLWFGTALGLTRLRHGQWAALPFDPVLSLRGNVATLEGFFRQVAQALFEARPLTTVRLGDVSFVEQFGAPLSKEDLIFSLVEDAQGRLWIGTLGGGIRRLTGDTQTLHLTRLDGLPSNLILALAVGPDGAIWAATDAGVSRMQEVDGTVTIRTFAAVDGLALPVQGVAVDALGTVWLATAGGLFRLMPPGGRVEGVAHDPEGRPVAGVDVVVQGTPFRAVTDAAGHFVLANLPPGPQRLTFDGRLAIGGPFTPVSRSIEVTARAQTLETVRLASTPQFTAQTGDGAQVTVHTPVSLGTQVLDRFGHAVAGVVVTFRLLAGNGSLAPDMVTTGADGQAITTLTVGTTAGPNRVEASAAGLEPVVLTVTGMADRATARLIAVSGNDQVGLPGQILPEPLVIRLLDQFANPLVGDELRAEIIEGAGAFVDLSMSLAQRRGHVAMPLQVSGGTVRTERADANGEARFFLRVDSLGGVVRVRATAPALPQAGAEQFRVNVARLLVGDGPSAVVVADLNGDGHLDLVTANQFSADVSVRLGRGNGTFAAEQRVKVDAGAFAVAVADVNGDGRLDLVTAGGGDVSVLLGRGDGTFAAPQLFSAGGDPFAVAVADVNGDGRPDLLTANIGFDDVSVLLGRGDGTFAAPQRFPVGEGPFAVAVADVNGDGRPDLVTANHDSNDVSVLLGRGDGTFAAEQRLGVGQAPRAVAVADVNGDGRPDLLTANAGSDDVSVLLSQDDGTFVEQRFPVGDLPSAIAVADVNGDGHPDLVTANSNSNDVSVLLGRGDGTFAAQPRFVAGLFPRAVTVVDLNGDGRLDLLTANADSDDVSVLLGRGDGTFAAEQRLGVGQGPQAVAVADVNSDGHPDLVTANYDSNNVSVLLGRGDGTFAAEQRLGVGQAPRAVAVADVNGDGHPDLVTANESSNDVSVLLGQGDGTFATPQHFPVGEGPVAIAVADLNGDRLLDLVTANGTSSDASVLLGRGDGTFAAEQRVGAGEGPQAIAVADVNGDGRLDLVTANSFFNDVSVLEGQGDGTFAVVQRFRLGDFPAAVTVADLNGDGRLDLLANSTSDEVAVRLRQPDGTFAAEWRIEVGRRPAAIAVADVNGDGLLDLLTANAASDDVSVLLGRGDGTFAAQQRFIVGGSPAAVAVADVNGDGLLDLLTANTDSDDVSVLLARGNGTFAAEPRVGVGQNPLDVAVADVNGDGRPDLVTANSNSNDVSVLLGQGDGTFAPEQRVGVGDVPFAIAVADVNGDGRPDLVTANSNSNDVSVLLGQGDGTFAPEQRFPVGQGPIVIAVADLNSDGRADLVTANSGLSSSSDVSVLLGQGDGTFAADLPIAIGLRPSDVVVADLNRDGRPDLVTAGGDVSVLLGQGDGTFAAPQSFPVGGGPFAGAVAVAVADVNGDGLLDLVTALNDVPSNVSVLRGRGDGTFAAPQSFLVGGIGPSAVAVADVDGDSRPDLLTANTSSGDVSVLLGQGDGTFAAPQPFRVGNFPSALAVADLNGDGRLDLVTTSSALNDVSVLRGRGDGTFERFSQRR